MSSEATHKDAGFTEFVTASEPKLRHALTATLGIEEGREAAAESLVYAWEHWGKVRVMENPVGYLYVLGRNRGRGHTPRRRRHFAVGSNDTTPWIEPGLPAALEALSERERTVVLLLHGYGWAMSEVASTLGVSKSSVQTYGERAMEVLRRKLGVPV